MPCPDAVDVVTFALTQLHLEAGRRLLAFQRAGAPLEYGCKDVQQYGICKHDVPGSETRAMVRVAEMLETLPALRNAAENGELSWWQLRLLTPYATPESDEACVLLAKKFTVDQLTKALRDVAGCRNTCWLEVHHIVYYYKGGRTVYGNLVILCSACHRLIHLGLLVLTGEAPDGLEFKDKLGGFLRIRDG